MAIRPKTIEIFLTEGDPKGVKVASITSRTVEVTHIPRSKIKSTLSRDVLNTAGVYFLVGSSEGSSKHKLYIGEAEKCLERISQHNNQKDFWSFAYAVTSKTQFFTKTHVKFLEWLCYDKAIKAKKYILENRSIPSKPFVSESLEADLFDNFETLEILCTTLGLNAFEIFDEKIELSGSNDKFFIKATRGANAQGFYTEDGFVVLQGSKCSKNVTKSVDDRGGFKVREDLITDKVLIKKDGHLELSQDFIFSSPSTAASVVLGRYANGWAEWKNIEKQTLSKVYRED